MSNLNGDAIRQQRIEARLSLTVASDLLGVRRAVLQRIEAGDPDGVRQVTVTGLIHFAAAVDCSPGDLFTRHAVRDSVAVADGNATQSEEADAATVLAGFLLAKGKQVSVRDIGKAIGWSRRKVVSAKIELAPRLLGTGIRIAERGDMLWLSPTERPDVDRAVAEHTKDHLDRRGINDGVARVLGQILDGSRGPSGNQSVFTRSAVSTLTSLGALDQTGTSPTPSAALLYALDRQ
jgi:transcriptional regulator with XRE-family HTH domain